MTTANKSVTQTWARAIAHPGVEFPSTPLTVISGKIPNGLRGTLYRNGPGRLERGNRRVGHWFDGDGAILAVNFTEAGASSLYRYVQTSGYQEETAANQYLYGNYGMTAPGAIWHQWLKPIKNAANTSVLALPDKLLALWEGGKPHALDLKTLATWGLEDLSQLGDNLPYSAHPKRDPETGEIFNFGLSPSLNSTLNVYKSDATGKIIKKATVPLDGIPLVHDFAFAGQYLVFFVPPVRLNFLPTAIGLSSFSEALEWQPKLGTKIIVVDRETLEVVSSIETDSWYQWHFANGFVDNGTIAIDYVRYSDFKTNQYLKEVPSGETHTFAKGTLWRIKIDPQTGKVKTNEEILDKGCEFPIVPQSSVGKNSPEIYLVLHRDGVDISKDMFNAIARFNPQTQTLTVADCGENRYPSEPIYAPDAGSNKSWILTVVYDGNTDKSEVWIYASDRLNESPVCRLELPGVIPMSFHGTWKGER